MENCNSIEDANGGALDADVGISNKIPRAVYATTISKEEYPFGTPILAIGFISKEDSKMPSRLTLIPLTFGVLLFASGCSNRATATLSPGIDLTNLKTFYVVHQPKDTHNIHYLISDKLVREGYTATAGPELPQSSYKVDSLVTYVDRWMWDITLYLLELTVTFRDATNGFPLAVGNSYHTSLTRKSPEEMVDEVLTNILNTSKEPKQSTP